MENGPDVSIPSEAGRLGSPVRAWRWVVSAAGFQSPRGGETVWPALVRPILHACFHPLGGVGASVSLTQSGMMTIRFQSPRRWGGVGLPAGRHGTVTESEIGFNPLGGGAGSGSDGSRSRWCPGLSGFNPLGGGAGSGSAARSGYVQAWSAACFNPLGGGAGSGSSLIDAACREPYVCFNPLGGGAGSGSRSRIRMSYQRVISVSIPSEVGRGRALDSTFTRRRYDTD